MKKKLPYFPFYYLDWLSSSSVSMMSYEEKGLFIDMLSRCYNDDGLPDDNDKLQRLFHCDEKTLETVKEMFFSDEGTLKNNKLESIKKDQKIFIKSKSDAGKASAKARAVKRLDTATSVEHVLDFVATEGQRNSTNITEQNITEHNKEKSIPKKAHALELPTMINPEECKTNSRDIMRYLETYQKIKSFNYSEDFSKVQGAYAEAVHHCEGGEAQVIQAAKDYLYFCQHMNESAKYRANHVSFLNKHQFKTDWLIQAENDFMAKNPKATGGTPMVPQFQERDKLEIELGIKFKWEVE